MLEHITQTPAQSCNREGCSKLAPSRGKEDGDLKKEKQSKETGGPGVQDENIEQRDW